MYCANNANIEGILEIDILNLDRELQTIGLTTINEDNCRILPSGVCKCEIQEYDKTILVPRDKNTFCLGNTNNTTTGANSSQNFYNETATTTDQNGDWFDNEANRIAGTLIDETQELFAGNIHPGDQKGIKTPTPEYIPIQTIKENSISQEIPTFHNSQNQNLALVFAFLIGGCVGLAGIALNLFQQGRLPHKHSDKSK